MVGQPLRADVDGDGSLDAVVPVQCTEFTATNVVFASAPGQPRQMGPAFAGTHLSLRAGNPVALVVFEAKPIADETPETASHFEELVLQWTAGGFQRVGGRLLDRASYFAAIGGHDPLPPPPSTTVPGQWTDIAEQANRSVLKVEGVSCDGQWIHSGTGFLLDAEHVVTAAHVVGDNPNMTVAAPDGTEADALVVAFDLDEDIALLWLDAPMDAQLFELAADDPPRQGTEIAVIGYSQGLNRIITGVISATDVKGMTYHGESATYAPSLMLLHDAATFPGDSGGPVIDRSGRVVGVHTAGTGVRLSDDYVGIPGTGWAVDARVVSALIDDWSDLGDEVLSCEPGMVWTEPPEVTTSVPVAPPSYEVLMLDTVRGIARAFNVTPEQIVELNDLANPSLIFEGQRIVLPPEARPVRPSEVETVAYTVRNGDTVVGIASRTKPVTPAEILALNDMLDDPHSLRVGQVILLPVR